MPKPLVTDYNGHKIHHSVGAVIKRDNKYLLIERREFPLGFAGLAGHIDEGEEPKAAVVREVFEEGGLEVTNAKLLYSEMVEWNECSYHVKGHFWHLYECETKGELKIDAHEAKSFNWYSAEEIKHLQLELVWKYWLEKIGII